MATPRQLDDAAALPARHCLVFDHIPKTAGSSFHRILAEHYFCLECNSPFDLAEAVGVSRCFRQLPANVALTGHFTRDFEQLSRTGLPTGRLTFLRDPWQRFLSEYKFKVNNEGFTGTLEDHLGRAEPNYLSRWIGNGAPEAAAERLAQSYLAFGLVERFDDSLALFSRVLGLGLRSGKRVNVSPQRRLDVAPGLRERFLLQNAADVELYAYGQELFRRRLGPCATEADPAPGVATGQEALYTPVMADRQKSVPRKVQETPAVLLDIAGSQERAGEPGQAAASLARLVKADRHYLLDLAALLARQGEGGAVAALAAEVRRHLGPCDTAYARLLEGCAAASVAPPTAGAAIAPALDLIPPRHVGVCAVLLAQGGQVEQALELVQGIQASSPLMSRSGCALVRAEACLAAGRQEQALRELRLAQALDPGALEPLRRLVEALLARKEYLEARKVVEDARLPEVERPWALALRGEVLACQGEAARAGELLQDAAAQAWDIPQIVLPWAVWLRGQGRAGEAVEALRRLGPGGGGGARERALVHRELAVCLYHAGKKEEAWELVRRGGQEGGHGPEPEAPGGAAGAFAGKRLCLVHAGPLMLLEWCLRELRDGQAEAAAVICFSRQAREMALAAGAGSCCLLPAGGYVHARDRALVPEGLLRTAYDAVLLLTSTGDPGPYGELLALAGELAAPVRAQFSFGQLLRGQNPWPPAPSGSTEPSGPGSSRA